MFKPFRNNTFNPINFYPTMDDSREMLNLNPNDNQWIHHLLTGYYLEPEMVSELTLLWNDS